MIRHRINENLNNIITKYLKSKGIACDLNFTTEVPPKNINADFAVNVAMVVSKKLKINSKIIAYEITNIINKKMTELIEKAEISNTGFINLHIKNEIFYKELCKILEEKTKYGSSHVNNREKIILEFVSANPTGPLHIGHGRGAAIGDSLSRILKHLGYNITKEYYINDAGNQMLILAKSTEIRYRQLKGEKIDFPANHYQGIYIIDIAKRLVSEGRDISGIDFRYESIKDILKTIKNDLRAFAVEFDNWFSESKMAMRKDRDNKTDIDKACEYLITKGSAYIKDAALWLATTKFGDDKDRVLRRSDGRYTYFASDVAYHKNKFERGFVKFINLWGVDHYGYVARIKSCIQMLGFSKEVLNIALYQLVSLVRNGKTVTMSTRTGEFVTLKEIVDEVGKDVCRFFFLLRAPDSRLEFDLGLAKKQSSENPVFYVQYVNARCNSIIRESKNRNDIIMDIKNINFSLLNRKEERDLIKQLVAFRDILRLSEKTMSPHHFTTYLIELANIYHKFYEKCRVLTDDARLASARLKLIEGVMIIIQNGLNLLGISVPNNM
ncbi:MAG: arginine--tRNA ligase [Endomicrobium sp.]|jgi:arginyl-tRNA synthetase|nr:arginine--tRNA ligase [Endomicrobium sp.]